MSSQPLETSRRPLRRSEYDRLVADGAFADERIELLEGTLVAMSPEGPPHAWVIQRLTRILAQGLADGLDLRVGAPWVASEISEPEPDLAIVPAGDYRHDHPAAAVLLIEVAQSSRRTDLELKADVYARADVPTYWVVDLADRVVHVHADPGPDGYTTVVRTGFDDTLDAAGVRVRIADILLR